MSQFGYRSAKAKLAYPPMECPTRCALLIDTARITALTLSAMKSMPITSSLQMDLP